MIRPTPVDQAGAAQPIGEPGEAARRHRRLAGQPGHGQPAVGRVQQGAQHTEGRLVERTLVGDPGKDALVRARDDTPHQLPVTDRSALIVLADSHGYTVATGNP
jgi:hypothetical protein